MKFTEAQLEAAIIQLLGEVGYPRVNVQERLGELASGNCRAQGRAPLTSGSAKNVGIGPSKNVGPSASLNRFARYLLRVEVSHFTACRRRQGLINLEVNTLYDQVDRSICEQKVGVSNVRCRNVSVIRIGTVRSVAGLK